MDIERIANENEWSSLLFQMGNGSSLQIEALKLMDEVEFYRFLKDHKKRKEFEAKHPRIPFF
ncbi:hypothetical protein [Winogradskyella forsetii]|uniref:hypothetical protein n=1 Tax=Winogradskyella forsetii TaxID=2686077 RepID=UPI0015BDCC63|nr:hypothetical protein [Winogradskyella forsetii]